MSRSYLCNVGRDRGRVNFSNFFHFALAIFLGRLGNPLFSENQIFSKRLANNFGISKSVESVNSPHPSTSRRKFFQASLVANASIISHTRLLSMNKAFSIHFDRVLSVNSGWLITRARLEA